MANLNEAPEVAVCDFVLGDVVTLKSGGEPMTVVGWNQHGVEVAFWGGGESSMFGMGSRRLDGRRFPQAVLILVQLVKR